MLRILRLGGKSQASGSRERKGIVKTGKGGVKREIGYRQRTGAPGDKCISLEQGAGKGAFN